MPSIPEHILAQIPRLAAEGLPVEQIAFLLRLQPAIVEAELHKHQATATPERPSRKGTAPGRSSKRPVIQRRS